MYKKANWDGEHCQKCYRPYRMSYDIDDRIWNSVVLVTYNLLCIDCFDEMAKQKNIKYKAKIYWAGFGEIYFPNEEI